MAPHDDPAIAVQRVVSISGLGALFMDAKGDLLWTGFYRPGRRDGDRALDTVLVVGGLGLVRALEDPAPGVLLQASDGSGVVRAGSSGPWHFYGADGSISSYGFETARDRTHALDDHHEEFDPTLSERDLARVIGSYRKRSAQRSRKPQLRSGRSAARSENEEDAWAERRTELVEHLEYGTFELGDDERIYVPRWRLERS